MAHAGAAVHVACAFSLIEILAVLHRSFLHLGDGQPGAADRDYLVLSKGHGVMAQYACLRELGWLSDMDIQEYFRDGTLLKGLSAAANLVYLVIVPILSFFFLKDGRSLQRSIVGQVEDRVRRGVLGEIARDLNTLLAQYMRALVLLGLAASIAYGAFFSIMGVPYALLLAALAFPLEFIPMIGPLTASIVILLVAGFSRYPHGWALAIFLGAYRIFQDYVLSPHLMSSGMELHPLLVVFGVFAGEQIAGIPGAFLSVPVMAVLRMIYGRLERTRLRQVVAVDEAEHVAK